MLKKVILVLRIALGLVFCYAAYTKLREPWLVFAMSIDAYGLLPAWAVFDVARVLPWVELAIGLMLIGGWFLRYVAIAATLLLGVFYAVMIHAYAGGAGIDCGCFGIGEAVSARTVLRDGALLGAAVLVTVFAFRGARGGWGRGYQSAAG